MHNTIYARNVVDDVNVGGARSDATATQRRSRPTRMPQQFGLVARRVVVIVVIVVIIVIVVVVSVCRCVKEL